MTVLKYTVLFRDISTLKFDRAQYKDGEVFFVRARDDEDSIYRAHLGFIEDLPGGMALSKFEEIQEDIVANDASHWSDEDLQLIYKYETYDDYLEDFLDKDNTGLIREDNLVFITTYLD